MTKRYTDQAFDILEGGRSSISTIKPSEWNELHRVLSKENSPFPGPFRYDRSPYLREIVDCLMPDHPAKTIAFMKGAQIGGSVGVIEAGIGWIISENPGNTLLLSGHQELSEEMMSKRIDQMIDSTGLRPLIRPNTLRKRNSRTGDTAKSKEFPGGSLVAGSASNHALLAQRSIQYAFIDDYDDVKASSKSDGSTTKLIEQRLAAYASKMKLFYISTPRVDNTSNIKPLFLKGDQRRWNVPCPCCGEYIPLFWAVDIDGTGGEEKGGITYKLDPRGRLIAGSVGYICQKCSGFFDDSRKYEMNLAGYWVPTAEPSKSGFYSYHMSSLYAPPGAYDWEHYVQEYLEAHPMGGAPKEALQQTFYNLCLGETFVKTGEAPKASELQKNIGKYEIGILPEKISIQHGNGMIVLVTAAFDLNGTEHDARMDYEVVAWAESGASYSIQQGSIGTFVPREGSMVNKPDRARWSYDRARGNSVWPEVDKILEKKYLTDTGRSMKILLSGVDCGHPSIYAYDYIDKTNHNAWGLKGDKESKFTRAGIDVPVFKPARERSNLYILEVNKIKDELNERIKLNWDPGMDDAQPAGFMNFPQPAQGQYLYASYFSHYEAEHRITETKDGDQIAARWVKKSSIGQNHFWDVHVYNMAVKEIITWYVCKQALKIKNYTWSDFVKVAHTLIGKKI
jgi:phage terminase large subunit GpA-like protein